MGIPWLGDPLTMQLLKNLVTPAFDGTNERWGTFVLDWDKYLQKLAKGRKITNFEKLQLLESCLDPTNRRELQYLTKAADGREILFSEFWAKLTDRYGEDIHGCNRKNGRHWLYQIPGKLV